MSLRERAADAFTFFYRRAEERRTGRPSTWTPPPAWAGEEIRLEGDDRPLRRRSDLWAAFAKHLAGLGADPWDYVAAAFDFTRGELPLNLAHLRGPRFVHAWRATLDGRRDRCRAELDGQVTSLAADLRRYAAQGLGFPRNLLAALSAPATGYTDLFRYCAAVKAAEERPEHAVRLREAARRWAPGALKVIVRHLGGYVEAWGDMVPARLRERAELARRGGA